MEKGPRPRVTDADGVSRGYKVSRGAPHVLDKEGVLSGTRGAEAGRPRVQGREGVPSRGASHLRGVGEAGPGVGRELGQPGVGRGAGAGRGGAAGQLPGADDAGGTGGREQQQQRGAQRPGQPAAGGAGGLGRPRGLGVRDGVRAGAHDQRQAAKTGVPGSPLYSEPGSPAFRGGDGGDPSARPLQPGFP